MTSFILYTVFINLLISVLFSFGSHYILGKNTSGGFWIATIITLVGAYVGTFFGILLQILNLNVPQAIVQFVFPAFFSITFLFLFVLFDHFNHQG